MFADDMKMFRKVNLLIDGDLLQSELNILYDWCTKNYLSLNIKIRQIMTFSKTKLSTNYNYFIDGETLLCPTSPIKDLGTYVYYLIQN